MVSKHFEFFNNHQTVKAFGFEFSLLVLKCMKIRDYFFFFFKGKSKRKEKGEILNLRENLIKKKNHKISQETGY